MGESSADAEQALPLWRTTPRIRGLRRRFRGNTAGNAGAASRPFGGVGPRAARHGASTPTRARRRQPRRRSASVRTRRIREFARDVLGFETFRPGQEAAMQSVVAGRDTLAVLPSGAGKTAVYQVAGQLLDGPVIVVSPLIALQRDQVERLAEIEDRAGRAVQLNSTLSAGDQREVLEALQDGTVRFVFLAPEQLTKPEVVDAVARGEAGAVRRRRGALRLRLGPRLPARLPAPRRRRSSSSGHPTVLALTATAAPPVRAEIVERLEMRDPEIVVAGFDRPEIRLEVDHYADAYGKEQGVLDRVLAEIGEGRGPGIVYSATRKGTEEIAAQLTDRGLRAPAYHAGLSKADREDTQRAWMDDELDVVVATTAFGMGIDKPGTRFVVHAEPADSVDSYYQEIGRAGRDGQPALAVLVYRQEDLGIRRFFAAGTPAEEELQQVAGLVVAAAAAGIDRRRRRQGPARGDRPRGHAADPRPQPARGGRRPSS